MDRLKDFIARQGAASIHVKKAFFADVARVADLKHACTEAIACYRRSGKMMFAGNGGSAADAQHLAAELVSRFYFDRPALPALAFNTNTSSVTAIGNDYGYDKTFARQLEAYGVKGDIFVALSTSGNSKNILAAVTAAKSRGIFTIGLTGETGGAMREACDLLLCVPSRDTPRIQECHILIGHILCAAVEEALFGKGF
jgi:D-sedoheptulose 7-phosphate isomerase